MPTAPVSLSRSNDITSLGIDWSDVSSNCSCPCGMRACFHVFPDPRACCPTLPGSPAPRACCPTLQTFLKSKHARRKAALEIEDFTRSQA